MRRTLTGLSGLVLAASLIAAPPPSPTELTAGLGDRDFRRREECGRRLDALGNSALPALLAATESEDPEVARRAIALVERIENRLNRERLLTPPRVDLDFDDRPLTDVLAYLQRETGLRATALHNHGDRRVTLRAQDLTPWEALDRATRAAGLAETVFTPTSGTADGVLLDDVSPVDVPATDLSRAVRIRAVPLPPLVAGGPRRVGLEVRGLSDCRVQAVDFEATAGARPVGDLTLVPAVPNTIELADRLLAEQRGEPLPPTLSAAVRVLRFGERGPYPERLDRLSGTVSLAVRVPSGILLKLADLKESVGRRPRRLPDGTFFQIVADTTEGDERRLTLRFSGKPAGVPTERKVRGFLAPPLPVRATFAAPSLHDADGTPWRRVESSDVGPPEGDVWEYTATFRRPSEAGPAAQLLLTGSYTAFIDVPFDLKRVPVLP